MPCPVSPAELCTVSPNALKDWVGGSLSIVYSLLLAAVFVSLMYLHSPLMTSSGPVYPILSLYTQRCKQFFLLNLRLFMMSLSFFAQKQRGMFL